MTLYLGEPDFDDVESAARLLVRYRNAGGLTPDAAAMFFQMVEKPDAVLAQADVIDASAVLVEGRVY